MSLRQNKFIFLDCQTTGMRPPAGQLIELAWCVNRADEAPSVQSHLIALAEGADLPARVSELTGIQAEDLLQAPTDEQVFDKFCVALAADQPVAAVIHYAQFEKPFLTDLFLRHAGQAELPFQILCSHQLTKRLFPDLPSQNIRGAAGFFGAESSSLKRAAAHVAATHQIWRGIVLEFEKLGIADLAGIQQWLELTPRKKLVRYAFRVDKLKRLELPDRPGIYRMLSKSGDVLYVGKATSLKDRVNSYV
jgi:DNA polymerase-3 subunit epsilon